MPRTSLSGGSLRENLLYHFDLGTKYDFDVLGTTLKFVLQNRGVAHAVMSSRTGRKISGPDVP